MTEEKTDKPEYGPKGNWKLTPEVRTKIEEAAAIDASFEEIAFYAGVSRNTLYRWMETEPGLRDRIEDLRQRPILKARQTVVKALEDPNQAFRYLEKKRRAEFGVKAEVEVSGTLKTEYAPPPEGIQRAVKAFEDAAREELTAPLPLPAPAGQENALKDAV